MKVYHYDNLGRFTNADDAALDPIESLPLVPRNATLLEPPAALEGHYVAFADGAWHQIRQPQPSPDALREVMITEFETAVQNLLDSTARARGYDHIISLCSYAGDPNPRWDAEGQAGRVWRSAVWQSCAETLSAVLSGTREAPTKDELIESLPKIVWPS